MLPGALIPAATTPPAPNYTTDADDKSFEADWEYDDEWDIPDVGFDYAVGDVDSDYESE